MSNIISIFGDAIFKSDSNTSINLTDEQIKLLKNEFSQSLLESKIDKILLQQDELKNMITELKQELKTIKNQISK